MGWELEKKKKKKASKREKKKEEVTKSKSLIKTDLFAAELCITWLLLLFSIFPFFVFPSCLSLTHSLSIPFIVTLLTTYALTCNTLANEFLPNVFFSIVCYVCVCICVCYSSHSFWHVFFPFFLTRTENLFSVRREQKQRKEKLKKKNFTNKQQIKIWQKCVQIIMECREKKESKLWDERCKE